MTIPLQHTQHFTYGTHLSLLEQAILKRTSYGRVKYSLYGSPEITAPLEFLATAVESAFVLTPREALPKVGSVEPGAFGRHFYFTDGRNSISASSSYTSERARKVATSYLAVAAYLEVEEKAKEKADAEAAKVAEAAAKNARQSRLNDIADLYFGKDFGELGDNKAGAVKEIYRLEEKLADQKDAA